MKRTTRHLLKAFVIISVLFSVIVFFTLGFLDEFPQALGISLTAGLVFGGVFLASMVLIEKLFHRKSGSPGKDFAIHGEAGLECRSPRSLEEIRDIFDRHFSGIGYRRFAYDETEKTYRAWTRMSPRSWGEKITVQLTTSGEVPVSIRFLSRPLWPTTLFDYGKNEDNLEELRRLID